MVILIMAIGLTVKLMGRGLLNLEMEMCMKVNLKITLFWGKVF